MPKLLRLDSKPARLKLPKRGVPYFRSLGGGVYLGYRAGPASWSARWSDGHGGKKLKSLGAIADDHQSSDGQRVLDYWQAADKARRVARGQDGDGMPVTLDRALDDYRDDLLVRDGDPCNASVPRLHLTPPLLAMPVALLRTRELRSWRNALAAKMPASSVNRIGKSLKAALNLAASHDERILNKSAWTVGLASLPEADDTTSNLVLGDQQVRDLTAAAYAISDEFGLYVEVHAATGARSGQIAELNVGDLEGGSGEIPRTKPEPRLMMPSSLKGKNRRTRTRKPVPISAGLAQRLQQAAGGNLTGNLVRSASEPLLTKDGQRWTANKHRRSFEAAAKAARLPDGATIYALRHTVITRLLLKGVPVRLVASSLDTSVAMIEKTYSKFIADHGDDLMRRALLDNGTATVNADNVVALKR